MSISILLASCSKGGKVDERLLDTWKTIFVNEHGVWSLSISTDATFKQDVTTYRGSLSWHESMAQRLATFASPQHRIPWLSSARLNNQGQLEVIAETLATQIWTRE